MSFVEPAAAPDAVARGAAERPRRVLLVRPSALGDVCRTVPALATLARAYPEAEIDWLVRTGFEDAVSAHPDLGAVVPFPRGRFARMWRSPSVLVEAARWAGELRRRRYDAAFDLQGLLRSGLITRLTGARLRVGERGADAGAWLGYNRRYAVDPGQHTVDRMLALLAAHGLAPVRDMRLYVPEAGERWLAGYLSEPEAPYACLAPTARWRCKCWPIERYVQVARRLLSTGVAGERLYVVAAPDEEKLVRPLLDAFADDARVRHPSTTVAGLMALLSRARLLVCNDSAALHMAVGFDRPIVTMFGPTDPGKVGPYGRPDAVVQPPGVTGEDMARYRRHKDDQSLIARLSVESVWSRIEAQLQGV